MVEDEPEGLDQDNVDLSGNIVEDVKAEPNELPIYKNREDAFKALKKTETTYADENHRWVEIELPKSGVVGEKYKINVSKKVPHLEFALSDNIKFELIDKVFGKDVPPQLFGVAFKIEKLKDVDKFEGVWENIASAAGKTFNAMQAGDYLFEVSTLSGSDSTVLNSILKSTSFSSPAGLNFNLVLISILLNEYLIAFITCLLVISLSSFKTL